MNLNRFKAQKMAVKNGLILGLLIIVLNCVLTFVYLDANLNTILSYVTVPLIMFFAGLTGYLRMKQRGNISYAIQSSILTVSLGLVIGFTSLFILTFSFMEIVRNNPLTVQSFQTNGQGDLDTFIRNSVFHAATTSVPVSIILGMVSGFIGARISKDISQYS
jgi:thiamine transporter ThiT